MVLDYAQYGSLRNYLDENYKELSWNYKFSYLKYLASGLEHIHKNELIHRDLHPDANPLNRPTPKEIDSILYKWHRIITHQDFHTELYKQIKEADEFNNSLSTSIITSTKSLQIDFHKLKNEDNNIPEQKISDDYYEKNNNSESLQIDISQLKITDNIFSGEKNSDEYDDKQNDNMIKMESTASLSLQIDVFQLNINEDYQSNKSKGIIIQNN
ncbi:kinase-like domain-containing protein [Rhizophagus irregularis DAOM 181602=DAOM 197198]|nr:kinase-like domain-containing protein [Rhizophagus irregularis DAOM 181602=DAOM 197198]